jgi:TPR repeat protein
MLSTTVYRKFRSSVCEKACLLGMVLFTVLAAVLPARGQGPATLPRSGPAGKSWSGQELDALPRCVTRAMLGATVVHGHSVRVASVGATAQRAVEAKGGIGSAGVPQTQEELRRMYELFAKAARRGDPAAQVNLAIASLAGWGTPVNAGAALYWLNEAARQGFGLAYFDLGALYQNGCGVRQNYSEAARNFRLGAEAGEAASEMNLGYLYDQGLGVERDRVQAARWYRRAAEQGLAQAQFNLGDLYAQGAGIERNESEALVWFERAALQGHTAAQLMLAAMYVQGRGTARDLPMAYAWLTAARLAGDGRAEAQLRSIEPQLSGAEIAAARVRAVGLVQPAIAKATVAVLRQDTR